jgi:hypothetical protein
VSTARTITAFEVHVCRGGRWTIDAILGQEEQARHHFEAIARDPGIDAVRLVKELFSPASGRTATRTLAEHARHEPARAPAARAPAAAPPPPAGRGEDAPRPDEAAPPLPPPRGRPVRSPRRPAVRPAAAPADGWTTFDLISVAAAVGGLALLAWLWLTG